MSGNRLVFMIIFLTVFLLMMTIGILSGVSLGAGFKRAIWAAVFFTALSFGTSLIINRYVISDIKGTSRDNEADNPPETENIGQMVDIVISEPTQDEEEEIIGPPEANKENNSNEPLSPLITRQIDPNVEKVINSDPKRMADIIKKMSFE